MIERVGEACRLPAGAAGEDWETLRILAPYLQSSRYRAGQVLWTEGQSSGRAVLIERGRVKAVRVLPDGASVLLYVFSEGELFGFLPFVDGGPYPATAIAVDDVRARTMSRSALRQALQQSPELGLTLLQVLGQRLRQAIDRVGDQTQRSAVTRAAAALSLLLAGPGTASTTLIDVPRPIHDFAADVGMTPETFARAVTQLVGAGILHRLASPRVQVLDLPRLRSIASGRSAL